jgi:hypothetical protein
MKYIITFLARLKQNGAFVKTWVAITSSITLPGAINVEDF